MISGCGLCGSVDNGVGVLAGVTSNVGYRSFPMNRPISVATNTAKTGRYFNMFFAIFEVCIGQLLFRKTLERENPNLFCPSCGERLRKTARLSRNHISIPPSFHVSFVIFGKTSFSIVFKQLNGTYGIKHTPSLGHMSFVASGLVYFHTALNSFLFRLYNHKKPDK